ncbi:MAG: hypothetical protein H6746_19995 [Deltaproteobacteria bacterium]|nr:hypothetical protein [Deltaproteobacteria bacterium]
MGAPIGGTLTPASNVIIGAGDELRTVHFYGGSEAPAVLKFSSAYVVSEVGLGNGAGGASHVLAQGAYQFLFGTPQVADGTAYHTLRPGITLAFSNDVLNDADGDGVGGQLEASLGMCPAVGTCFSNATYDPADTDRDGLSDGEELWGVVGNLPDGSDDLPFARWGGWPTKKDIFLEVDWLNSFGSPVPEGMNPFQWMRDHPSWNGTLDAWVDGIRAPFDQAPAAHVRNPSGTQGVEVHLDLGVAPLDPSDESKYGNWSTGAARGVEPDFVLKLKKPIAGYAVMLINQSWCVVDATGKTPAVVAFTLALCAATSGEPVVVKTLDFAADGSATLAIGSSVAGLHFNRDFNADGDDWAILAEDAGSLQSAYTEESDQVDAIRRGRVRYAVATGLGGGGNAGAAAFVSGLGSAFAHELGHSVGLQHWGHDLWGNLAAACLPHYPSIMSYVQGPEFNAEDSGDSFGFNPASVVEYDSLAYPFDQTQLKSSPWSYSSPRGKVGIDWTRDGLLDLGSPAWRTTGLLADDQSCASMSVGRVNLAANEPVVGPLDLVRHGSRLYLIWSVGDALKYMRASLGAAGNKSCTGSSDPGVGPCLTWVGPTTLEASGEFKGVTAQSYGGILYVASSSLAGAMTVYRYSIDGTGGLIAIGSKPLPSSEPYYLTQDVPELVVRHSTATSSARLGLIYRDDNDKFASFGRVDATGTWNYEGTLRDGAGAEIFGGKAPAAKAWPDESVTGWTTLEKRTLAILPGAAGEVRVYSLRPDTNRWIDLNLEASLGTTTDKPFLEFRTRRTTTGSPDLQQFSGHFVIGWLSPGDDGARARFRLSRFVTRSTPPSAGDQPALSLLPAGDFLQNTWATTLSGTSAVLYSDSTLDNVFGAVPIKLPDANSGWNGINFYPHADGSPNHAFRVYSDFRVMEDYICINLASARPGGFNCGSANPFSVRD